MSITNRLKITISTIMLHSASSLQIPRSTARFNSLLPTVNVSLLIYLALPIILLKYKNPYKRNSMYPNISKCNAKSCTCCNHLICQSTIISSVNLRQFSVVNNSDLD